MRENENIESKAFSPYKEKNDGFQKKEEGLLSKILNKSRDIFFNSISKVITYIFVIGVFSFFGLNYTNIATGIVHILHGDIGSGVTAISETVDIDVILGEDPKWESYEIDGGYKIKNNFVYLGNGKSISKSPLKIKDVTNNCFSERECNEFFYVESKKEAEKICNNEFGASLPTYEILEKSVKSLSPSIAFRIKDYEGVNEITSTVDPEDDERIRLFIKNTDDGSYPEFVEDDSPMFFGSAFRCYLEL